MNGTITRVTVEAAAIVDSRCVRLRHPCGELWGMDADEQVQRRASELVRQLESDLLDGGLEIRARRLRGGLTRDGRYDHRSGRHGRARSSTSTASWRKSGRPEHYGSCPASRRRGRSLAARRRSSVRPPRCSTWSGSRQRTRRSPSSSSTKPKRWW